MIPTLLVSLIVACVLYWAVQAILSATGVGEPVATIVKVVFVPAHVVVARVCCRLRCVWDSVATMKRVRAALAALALASVLIFASTGDDLLRAFCAGIGPDHPLYDYLNCAELLRPSPEG